MGAAVVVVGLIVGPVKVMYAQLATEPAVPGITGYVRLDPQSHQLVGLNQGAPSGMHVGFAVTIAVATPDADACDGLGDVLGRSGAGNGAKVATMTTLVNG